MNPELLNRLRGASIFVKLEDGDRLVLESDHEPPAELLEAAAAHRAELLDHLRRLEVTESGGRCSVLPLGPAFLDPNVGADGAA